MKKYLLLLSFFYSFSIFAQEKGDLKTPNIPSQQKTKDKNAKDKNFNKPVKKEIDDFSFEEAPTLKFINEFQKKNEDSTERIIIIPVKEINVVVDEKKDSLDEFATQIVEIEPYFKIEGGEELVKGPSYFTIWDNKRKNPYNLKATEFDDVVALNLYNISEGKNWHGPLDKGRVTSEFKFRGSRWHEGVDLDLETGDPIYAPFDGIVRIVGWDGRGYGNYMVLRHNNGLETIHGHLSKTHLDVNTYIKAGDVIGLGGNTGRSNGSHLHFEMLYEGNPFNPRYIFEFLPQSINIIAQEFILTSRIFDYLRGKSTIVYEYDDEEQPVETSNVVWIKIVSGDTIFSIADRNGISIQELCKLNRISPKSVLKVGKKLRIQ